MRDSIAPVVACASCVVCLPLMRLVPLLALCLALPALAQMPDPTPPEAYYPLAIGDVRAQACFASAAASTARCASPVPPLAK